VKDLAGWQFSRADQEIFPLLSQSNTALERQMRGGLVGSGAIAAAQPERYAAGVTCSEVTIRLIVGCNVQAAK
jgi:hypothetical protein